MNTIIFDSKETAPTKVVCVGWNYVDHIEELKSDFPTEPVIFLKPNSSISNELVSENTKGFHYEGEIAFLIKNSRISGVGFGFDITKRPLQTKLKEKGQPWERAKSFDRSAVFSHFVPFNGDFSFLQLELVLNGKIFQKGGCELMIYKPDFIVEEIQQFMTLEDGDIIMTGTPKGVGDFKTGDRFIGRIYFDEKMIIEQTWTAK